jgi:hypothetical protein
VVEINDILQALKDRRDFNRLDLSEVEFTKDGEPVAFTAEELDEWKFTGLSNVDFIASRFDEL